MVKILLIDDDVKLTESIELNVGENRYEWIIAHDGKTGLELLESAEPQLVLCDIRMPKMDGITFLKHAKETNPEIPVIMITAYEDMETTIKAMQFGAFEYVRKPVDTDELELTIDRALETVQREKNLNRLVTEISAQYRINNLVGSTPAMQEIFKTIGQLTMSRVSVLINGESGTGKELIAKAIHYNSAEKEHPFVAVNCSAIPEGLIESELFGHEKGSFTGAIATTKGRFEECGEGTLFLDEIGDVPVSMQVKLLRVLQEKEFSRVGSSKSIPFKARVITATHRDLKERVEQETFREDLYYRIAVVCIEVPPLRERREDIPKLAEYLTAKINREMETSIKIIEPDAMDVLKSYQYQGNVRELENILRHAAVMAKGEVLLREYLPEIIGTEGEDSLDSNKSMFPEELVSLEEIERRYILYTLQKTDWKKKQACEALNIARTTLDRKIEQYGIKMPGKG
ncbi:MAG: sigma-54 dependent transcriptional regulator [Candidatus Electryonea clarkiae]|nr:sigma-54 dependent transcriptional regulator [Candidatus Electryonea clarkiae]MDP8286416.1 sigma-54 dependent transcriptional regulator [Candidatus Electryonea clarkiae]